MPRRKYEGDAIVEDRDAIKAAYDTGISKYASSLPPISVSQMLMGYNGSKSDLARALSSQGGGTYATQMKNISRWLAYENGVRDKNKSRNPGNNASQAKFKGLFASKNPPQGSTTVSISGWIGYPGDVRYRSITMDASNSNIDTRAFASAMEQGDTQGAYRVIFEGYNAPALSVQQADSMSITFN
jgi:hypothetical protein